MAKERDEWWRLKLQREQERQAVWEESLQTVVREGEALEKELRMRSRKRGSRFFDANAKDAGGTFNKHRPAQLTLTQAAVPEEAEQDEYFPVPSTIIALPPPSVESRPVNITSTRQATSPSILTPTLHPRLLSMSSSTVRDQADDDSINTDEEESFTMPLKLTIFRISISTDCWRARLILNSRYLQQLLQHTLATNIYEIGYPSAVIIGRQQVCGPC
jgi:hypothetical protein